MSSKQKKNEINFGHNSGTLCYKRLFHLLDLTKFFFLSTAGGVWWSFQLLLISLLLPRFFPTHYRPFFAPTRGGQGGKGGGEGLSLGHEFRLFFVSYFRRETLLLQSTKERFFFLCSLLLLLLLLKVQLNVSAFWKSCCFVKSASANEPPSGRWRKEKREEKKKISVHKSNNISVASWKTRSTL